MQKKNNNLAGLFHIKVITIAILNLTSLITWKLLIL